MSSATQAKRTYKYVKLGAKDLNTWISQKGSGVHKRQFSLQVMLHPEGMSNHFYERANHFLIQNENMSQQNDQGFLSSSTFT